MLPLTLLFACAPPSAGDTLVHAKKGGDVATTVEADIYCADLSCQGLSFVADVSSQSKLVSASWDLDDGTTAEGLSFDHSYTDGEELHSVLVDVEDGFGEVATYDLHLFGVERLSQGDGPITVWFPIGAAPVDLASGTCPLVIGVGGCLTDVSTVRFSWISGGQGAATGLALFDNDPVNPDYVLSNGAYGGQVFRYGQGDNQFRFRYDLPIGAQGVIEWTKLIELPDGSTETITGGGEVRCGELEASVGVGGTG